MIRANLCRTAPRQPRPLTLSPAPAAPPGCRIRPHRRAPAGSAGPGLGRRRAYGRRGPGPGSLDATCPPDQGGSRDRWAHLRAAGPPAPDRCRRRGSRRPREAAGEANVTLPGRRRGEGAGPEVDYNLVAAILPGCPELAGTRWSLPWPHGAIGGRSQSIPKWLPARASPVTRREAADDRRQSTVPAPDRQQRKPGGRVGIGSPGRSVSWATRARGCPDLSVSLGGGW